MQFPTSLNINYFKRCYLLLRRVATMYSCWCRSRNLSQKSWQAIKDAYNTNREFSLNLCMHERVSRNIQNRLKQIFERQYKAKFWDDSWLINMKWFGEEAVVIWWYPGKLFGVISKGMPIRISFIPVEIRTNNLLNKRPCQRAAGQPARHCRLLHTILGEVKNAFQKQGGNTLPVKTTCFLFSEMAQTLWEQGCCGNLMEMQPTSLLRKYAEKYFFWIILVY
jgi:hypothetical protein